MPFSPPALFCQCQSQGALSWHFSRLNTYDTPQKTQTQTLRTLRMNRLKITAKYPYYLFAKPLPGRTAVPVRGSGFLFVRVSPGAPGVGSKYLQRFVPTRWFTCQSPREGAPAADLRQRREVSRAFLRQLLTSYPGRGRSAQRDGQGQEVVQQGEQGQVQLNLGVGAFQAQVGLLLLHQVGV